MGAELRLEDESVWTALEAMRQAKSLGLAHPLTRFMTLHPAPDARHPASIKGIAAQDAIIFGRLSNFIRHHLERHRAVSGLAARPGIPEIDRIEADFSLHNDELEAWSVLYYRYVRVDLDYSLERLAPLTRQDKRTLNRRQRRGIARLTHELVQRELRLRNRYRLATLKAELPGYAQKLFGRDDLLSVSLEHLDRADRPRHLLLYGVPGVGKTALALSLAHQLLDRGNLDNVAWLEQPEDNIERLFNDLYIALNLPANKDHKLLASYLYRADTLIVLNHAQTLVDNGSVFDTVVQALGMARLIVCAERVLVTPLSLASVNVSDLDHESALMLLEETAKRNISSSGLGEHLTRLYNEFGGNPAALIAAVKLGSRYRAAQLISNVYRAAWDEASELSRLLWLLMALSPARAQPESEVIRSLPEFSDDSLHAARDYLRDSAVIQLLNADPPQLVISTPGRSFVDTVLTDPIQQPLVWATVQRRADRLVEQPDTAGCVLLLKSVQRANIRADLQTDLAYTFATVIERAGAWSAWARYLDPLQPQAEGEDRLWLGLQLGTAHRWLAQWKSAAYGLAGVIEEAGAAAAFSIQADAMVELAIVHRQQRQFTAANELLQRAEAFYLRQKQEAGYVRVTAERIQLALESGAIDTAWTTLDQIVERRGFGSPRLLSLAALVALRADRPREALRYAEDAQREYQGDLPHFARASALLGEIQFKIGNFSAAVDSMSAALDLMEQTHDLLGHARTQMNLSAVYLGQGNLRKALDLLRPLPAELERLGDSETLEVAVKNLALLNDVARHWKAHSAGTLKSG